MARLRQRIGFCTAADGTRIAFAVSGSGPPLVKAANYLTHLELDLLGPVWRHWLEFLSESYTLVRYDERGSGLSDRGVADYSIDAWVADLEAVVEANDLGRFSLLGMSQGAAVSVAYAQRHPDRLHRLILCGGYARGRLQRDPTAEEVLEAETMINAMKVGWGRPSPAFRQLFSSLLMPDAEAERMRALNEMARQSASAAEASRMERAFYDIDVTREAAAVSVPTLVLHATEDAAVPFEEGRQLAGLISGARFVPLDGRNTFSCPTRPPGASSQLRSEPSWAPDRQRPRGYRRS